MSTVPLCLHHSLEHVHALRSHERGCFRVVQTLWAEKIQSTTDAGSLNTFGRNEIEVASISSALLRIACLVILYKFARSGPRTRSRWGVRIGMSTRAPLLKQNENRRDGAATGPWSYLVVRSCGPGRAGSPHSRRARCPKLVGCRQARDDRFRSYRICGPWPGRDRPCPRRRTGRVLRSSPRQGYRKAWRVLTRPVHAPRSSHSTAGTSIGLGQPDDRPGGLHREPCQNAR